jgi:endonuclease/exonuclease/phosphatase (EEP) superfamily protein YafD
VGDLNCTPFARSFAALCETAGVRDSARGFSLTNTWHIKSTFLGLPLDHILVSPDILVAERIVGPAVGSDHRWVMARLVPVPP